MLDRVLRLYEHRLFALLGSALRPGMVFVDVGANKGDFTIYAARIVGEQGHVHSFEPDAENALWLRRTVATNRLRNVTVHETAISDMSGEATLYRGADSGTHSLVAEGDTDGTKVRVRRLSDALESPPDVLKVDVEGAEMSVMQGAVGKLAPLVVIEVHQNRGVDTGALHAFLERAGYRIESLRGDQWVCRRWSTDPR